MKARRRPRPFAQSQFAEFVESLDRLAVGRNNEFSVERNYRVAR
jgi:hypothetical protein